MFKGDCICGYMESKGTGNEIGFLHLGYGDDLYRLYKMTFEHGLGTIQLQQDHLH